MAEYIDREAAIKAIYDSDPNGIRRTLGFNVGQIEEALRAIPAADVVPAMRCEECAYHEDEEPGMVYCPRILGGWVSNEFFCGEGKRRTKRRTNANEPDGA